MKRRERRSIDPIAGDPIDPIDDDRVFILEEILYAHNQKTAREAYKSAYGRKLNDADVRDCLTQLVADAVSVGDESFATPTWLGVAAVALLKGAKKAHGRELLGSRLKMILRNFGRAGEERDVLREAEALWVELKAQKVPDPKGEAAKRAKKKHPELGLSAASIKRRMRWRGE